MFRATFAILALSLGLGGLAPGAAAQPLSFADWRDQRFQLFNRVEFTRAGQALSIRAEDAASMIYTTLPPGLRGARSASWSWEVSRSVPATRLDQRGGDDRNIALYFAFLPAAEAAALGANPSIRRLLRNPEGRVLVYVHGGDAPRGAMMRTPYLGNQGVVVIRRPAGTGPAMERVDLAADYARAFGGAPGALVAVAVSADSDDTDSVIDARLTGLTLE